MAVQSVELLLDVTLDAAVRGQWERLVAVGLPSQARHSGSTNAPHVTLAVRSSIPDRYDVTLAAVADLPLELRLGGLLVFAGRRCVLARVVVPDPALLTLHAAVDSALGETPGSPANLRPGAWTPHVTLARNLTAEQVGSAVAALAGAPDLLGSAVAVRRWDAEVRRAWTVAGG